MSLVITQEVTQLVISSVDQTLVITGPGATTLEISSIGVQGPPGAGSALTKVTAAAIAAGQVVTPNVVGAMVLAQADSVNNCRAAVVAATGAASGFTISIASDYLTLTDWTAATGAHDLVVGADYFLSPTTPGRLTTTVPTTGVVLHIGSAIDTTTLMLSGADPIML